MMMTMLYVVWLADRSWLREEETGGKKCPRHSSTLASLIMRMMMIGSISPPPNHDNDDQKRPQEYSSLAPLIMMMMGMMTIGSRNTSPTRTRMRMMIEDVWPASKTKNKVKREVRTLAAAANAHRPLPITPRRPLLIALDIAFARLPRLTRRVLIRMGANQNGSFFWQESLILVSVPD